MVGTCGRPRVGNGWQHRQQYSEHLCQTQQDPHKRCQHPVALLLFGLLPVHLRCLSGHGMRPHVFRCQRPPLHHLHLGRCRPGRVYHQLYGPGHATHPTQPQHQHQAGRYAFDGTMCEQHQRQWQRQGCRGTLLHHARQLAERAALYRLCYRGAQIYPHPTAGGRIFYPCGG